MREEILRMLRDEGGFLSGETISARLGVSRAAVWKHIKKLKETGYNILSVRNSGYKLLENSDPITADAVTEHLTTRVIARTVRYLASVDSTNEEAKRRSSSPDGTLFIADTQTGGKGRLGRGWVSERESGIWMSLLLKPNLPPSVVSQVTLICGMAVCRAIGGAARIKWPNDVVIGTRKVCGILTEMVAEADRVSYIVPGIGINVNTERFGKDLADKATSLFIETGQKHARAPLAAAVMNEFEPLYCEFIENGLDEALLAEYRSLCATLGRTVRVIYRNETLIGTAMDIDSEGGLVVDTPTGRITVTSGDVSVRGMYGYA